MKELISDFDQRVKEVHMKNFGAWFVRFGNTVDATGPGEKCLFLIEMPFSEYRELSEHFPHVLVGEMMTSFNQNIPGYNFVPDCEFAVYEELYLKCDDSDIVSVIVGSEAISEPDTPRFKKSMAQKTYLMTDDSGFVKIGKSFNPSLRFNSISNMNPNLQLIAVCENDVEKELHNKFDSKRFKGEWFGLSSKEVESIIKEYSFEPY